MEADGGRVWLWNFRSNLEIWKWSCWSVVEAEGLQAQHRLPGQGVCSECAARIAKGAPKTAGLSAADTPNQVQASHCSACVRVLSALEAQQHQAGGAKVQQMKAACNSPWAADKQTDGATGRPVCALLAVTVGSQRQPKANAQKAKTQQGLADPAGWEVLERAHCHWLVTLPLWAPPGLLPAACTKAVSEQLSNSLKRYAGVRAQQEAVAGSACSDRCRALAVCSSKTRAWTLYKGASGATLWAVQATPSAVQATFGAAKSV